MKRKRNWLVILAAAGVSAICLYFYGFSGDDPTLTRIYIELCCLFLIVYAVIGHTRAALLSFSIAVATIVCALYFEYKPPPSFYFLWVYDHELGHSRYMKNKMGSFQFFGGDLSFDAVKLGYKAAQPVTIHYKTDSRGFRNDYEYDESMYVFVGDSFIMGDVDQKDTISALATERYGLPSYNISYPTDVFQYSLMMNGFRKKVRTEPRFVLFLFEGNDFGMSWQTPAEFESETNYRVAAFKAPKKDSYFVERWITFVQTRVLHKILFLKYNEMKKAPSAKAKSPLRYREAAIRGLPIRFYEDYIAVSHRERTYMPQAMVDHYKSLGLHIERIFFLPTKYRVYYSELEDAKEGLLPYSQWECTQRFANALGVKAVNLTDVLKEEATKNLAEGKFVYYPLDTHLNAIGNDIVAREVVKELKGAGN